MAEWRHWTLLAGHGHPARPRPARQAGHSAGQARSTETAPAPRLTAPCGGQMRSGHHTPDCEVSRSRGPRREEGRAGLAAGLGSPRPPWAVVPGTGGGGRTVCWGSRNVDPPCAPRAWGERGSVGCPAWRPESELPLWCGDAAGVCPDNCETAATSPHQVFT